MQLPAKRIDLSFDVTIIFTNLNSVSWVLALDETKIPACSDPYSGTSINFSLDVILPLTCLLTPFAFQFLPRSSWHSKIRERDMLNLSAVLSRDYKFPPDPEAFQKKFSKDPGNLQARWSHKKEHNTRVASLILM